MSVSSMKQGLRNRLWVIDIPRCYQESFADLVIKWSHNSGISWTIKRLKSLKVDLYRRRAGLPPLTWVRKNRRGDLAGVLGGLFRWADKSERNFRKVVQTLMSYSMFVHGSPTKEQLEKFQNALSSPPPQRWGQLDTFAKSIEKSYGGLTVDRESEVSLLLYRGSPSKRKPTLGMRSTSQDSNILGDAEVLITSGWGQDLTDVYSELYAPVFKGLLLKPISSPFSFVRKEDIDPSQILGGKIGFIQEPGGKLRSVASPYLAHQLALQHFGKAVYGFSRLLPWDCTHDQSKPVHLLQANLLEGKTVHSVDLSSATDFFPLEVQSKCMRSLFGNILDIDLFETISRSNWISPIGAVRWNRGQPLGLFPSFAVFTVTHGMLLWYLNGCRWNKEFFVLGDDVVILNDDLHRSYLSTLEDWGCPYSPEKSLSSSRICEFAGKVITSESVTSQLKWRAMSDDNFVDICRQLGQRSRILLSKDQQLVFDKIKHCLPPLGLNFSYQGSSLLEMESLTHQTFSNLEKRVLESLVDRASVIHTNLYEERVRPSERLLDSTTVKLTDVLEMVSTFDEKVRKVLLSLLPWFGITSDPKLYSTVPEAVNCVDLPLNSVLPSRLSTLDRYSILLGIKS